MNKIKQFFIAKLFFLVIIIVVVDISVNVPSIVFAETRIEGSSLVGNASWNASNSPYIIESTLTVPKGSHLTVEAGTSIVGIPEMDGYPLIYVEGELDLLGTRDHMISVSGSGGISTAGGTTTIGYSDISLSNGLDFVHSYLSFANSTISSSTYAISIETTNALIVDSNIINNNYGIYVRKPATPVFLIKKDELMFGRGGIGNALDEANRISISDSSIVNNIQASILNETTDTVNAVENWWGTEQGPTLNGVNQIIGLVQYTPWLVSDPLKEKKSLCCSSVLFIPGLEGTRLYRQISLPLGLGNSTNRLWEPLLNINTEHLYLDANGRTQDPSIYSGGPIDIALGLKGVYGKLMNNLSDLVASGKISEWRPYGYDWRKPISEVVEGVEKKATTTDSLIATVKDMAARSMTGKVTLLAH
ncbi:MAG: hypothetical protein WCK03_02080, partial [Candidatus Taylorbacteria bacterium]